MPHVREKVITCDRTRDLHRLFLLGYVFAGAKKYLQVSSPSTKWGYPMISNNTSVALGVASEALVEDAGDGTSVFVCILT